MASFFEWLKNTTGLFSKQNDDSRRLEHATFPRVYDSQLEDRRVLNAGAVITAIDLVSLRFDAGQLANDGVADKFELSRLDSSSLTNQVAVSINNQRVWQGNAAEIQSIHFDGSSDADQFYIDPSIQIAAGIFIDGTAIASHSQSQAYSDGIVFASLPETYFSEITYQSRDALTQVQFVSTPQQLSLLVQVQNVESIRDQNAALERSLIVDTTGGSYTLRDSGNSATASMSQTIEWTSNQNRIEIDAPSDRLTIDLRSTLAGRDSLVIDSFNHPGVKHFNVLADDADSVQLNGAVTAGQKISVNAGTIGVTEVLSTVAAGDIRLVAGTGTLNVNGELISRGDELHRGGNVVLTGDRVLLDGQTRVDVSGGAGGGQIRVGGGFQGKDASVHNSRYTYVSPHTTLNADARLRGNGGTVIVWSDDTSIIDGSGNIFARGGIEGGDGGFIETSGKRYLRIDGAANTSANRGQSGNWLIDPNDIEIVTVAGADPNTSYVLISTIVTGLTTGNINIVTNTPSGGNGDIRIVDALLLAPTTSRTLTLNATRDIVFVNGLTGNADLQISLIAGRDVDSTAVSIGQLASLTISAARNISVGTINLSGGTLSATIDSNNDDANATFQSTGALSAGSISISGSATVNDNVTLGSAVTTSTGAIQFSQISSLTFQGDVTAATNVTFSSITGQLALGSSVDITANNGPIDFSPITSGILLAGNNGSTNVLTAKSATGALTLGTVSATNTNVGLTLSSATNTSVASINLQNGALTSVIDSDNDNVGSTFQATGTLSAGVINLSGSATVNDNVTLGSAVTTSTGAIQFSQISSLTFQGDVTAATNVTFSSITGQLALGSNVAITANSGPLDLSGITAGILLTGSNGSTNVFTANGTTGSLSMAAVSATNASVSLTLNSATDFNAEDINIQNGNLLVTYSGQNVASANVATFKKVTAGSLTVSGNSRTDDQTVLTDALTIGVGGVTINQFADLKINATVNSSGGVTNLGISGSQTHLTADVTSNGGAISMTGGTLFIDGSASRTISSRGGAVAVGGNIVLGNVDGENGAANLNVDSRGTSTAGSVSIGTVTAATSGLNRLNIRTDAITTAGQVTLSSTRLVEKAGTAATLVVASDGNAIRANGIIDLSSNSAADGGSIDFGASEVTPTNASSTLTLNTSNTSAIGGNGGDIKFAGVSNNGANYFDSVLIDTSTANAAKTDGDLDFGGKANPKIAVDGTSGTGISLIGTIVKAFSGVLSFLTNPAGASANSSSIDVSKANFHSTAGLKFDTFGGASTNAGDLVLGDIGVSAPNRPTSLTVDTRGTTTSGDLVLDDGSGASTELHVAGDLNLADAKIRLTDNALLRTYGTGNMALGDVATVGGVARNLTLNSEANIAVAAINLTGGFLTANVDSNDDNAGSTIVSTGALSAGTVSILGSASNNDNVTINSTLNTTTGEIQFAQVDKLVLNGDVISQTNITFTNVVGLSLGSNADVTANNGPLDFSTVTSVLQLVGSNGSTNILTSRGATGSLTLGSVANTNPNVSLALSSATNTAIGSANIQNGALSATIDSDNNDIGASFVSTGALNAASVTISGSTTVNDRVTLGSTVTTTIGAIQVNRFEDLRINGDWTTAGGVTTTGVSTSQTHLAANITSNGGNVAMTGGTLLINGTTVRQIKSGGASVNAINGGSVTLGVIDGEVTTADLEIDSRGSSTSGGVTLGNATNAAGNTGLNRLNIQTDGVSPGQVSLSSIRLIAKNATPASLTITAGGRTILADGSIDLSSNVNGRAGGRINFGTSVVAPKSASSTLVINTSNSDSTSGVDGSDGGDMLLGGIGVNATSATFFDSVTIDLSAADILDAAGTLRFGTVANPSIQVDGVSGTGIRIVGRVDNAAGKVLSLSTNPAGASQNSSAIDVSKATFIGSGSLIFDTSSSNQSLTSGSITLGDIGTIVRPVSLVINTLGAVSSGHLILNDTVVGSATEIRIDGTIDFSNFTVDLLDDVLLESHLDGNSFLLGTTNAVGGARNLQLASDSGMTVAAINLAGGAFQANVDVNNNEVGSIFRSTGTIAAGSFAAAGSAANNDIASIGGGVTTTGSVSFSNFDQLRIQALIDAGTTFNASGIVGAVDFSGNSGIIANGSIDLRTSVNAIKLSGVAGNTTLIDAKGNTSVVTLATVTAINPETRLNVRSDYSSDLQNVEMLTGTLDVQIGRSTTQADASVRLRQVKAGGLVVTGTSTANDAAVLDGVLNIGTNGISIQNLAKLDVNFNVQSVGDINATNILNRIQVAEAVAIQSNQSIDLQTNVGQIQLMGIHGLMNTFRADGDSGSLKLGAIQALGNVVLVLSSANDITVASIDAVGSNLSIKVDNNNNTNGSQLVAGQIQTKQMSVLGGTDLNDVAVFNGLLESKSGSLLVSSFGTVNLKGNAHSSSGLELSNVSGRVNIDAGRLIKAANGTVALNNSVGAIRFLGGAGTSSSIQAVNGDLLMSAITELNTSDLIELRADRDVILASSSLNSRLLVVAGDHNNNFGSINASATLTAGAIDLQSANGIGTNGAVATSTSAISATNRLSGLVQIANDKSVAVTVSSLTANQGGNILFTQSGGGDVRFQQVTSNADGTPAVNESDIRLTSVGSGLIVDGNGVSAGGLGIIVIQTQNTGDVQLLAATRTNGGTLAVQSAERIIGGGTLSSRQVDLNATSGIGTTGAIQTQTTQLRANSQSNSLNVQNSSAALTTVSQLSSGGNGTVQFNQVGGGDVAFLNVSTGLAPSNAGTDVNLRNSGGSVLVQGSVVAGGGGSIRFDAQNNLLVGAGSLVQTNGVNATISGNAGGQFLFTPGAALRAGSSNASTEAVVTVLPPLVSVRPTVNSIGVNVDSEGFATLQIQLGSASPALIDRNFSVVIDWGDKQIDQLPNGMISPSTTNPQIARFDGSGVIYQITHQYQGNPNPLDPIADIPVKVTVGVDALNRIQFNDSKGPVTSLSYVVNESLVTPAAGLISLRFDLPQAPTIPNRIVFNNSGVVQSAGSIAPVATSAEASVSSSSSAAEKGRSYVLRIITPVNEQGEVASSEDIELTVKDIEALSTGKLFQKLGDNRYRIYLIREDGNELLLKDFYLRNHRPFEVEDSPPSSNELPVEERVLDQPSAAITGDDHGSEFASKKSEESEFDLQHDKELNGELTVERVPITNAVLAVGTFAQRVRSWRKAARRFRAV